MPSKAAWRGARKRKRKRRSPKSSSAFPPLRISFFAPVLQCSTASSAKVRIPKGGRDYIILGSSMVERSAVNRRVPGSSPGRGANSFKIVSVTAFPLPEIWLPIWCTPARKSVLSRAVRVQSSPTLHQGVSWGVNCSLAIGKIGLDGAEDAPWTQLGPTIPAQGDK